MFLPLRELAESDYSLIMAYKCLLIGRIIMIPIWSHDIILVSLWYSKYKNLCPAKEINTVLSEYPCFNNSTNLCIFCGDSDISYFSCQHCCGFPVFTTVKKVVLLCVFTYKICCLQNISGSKLTWFYDFRVNKSRNNIIQPKKVENIFCSESVVFLWSISCNLPWGINL